MAIPASKKEAKGFTGCPLSAPIQGRRVSVDPRLGVCCKGVNISIDAVRFNLKIALRGRLWDNLRP